MCTVTFIPTNDGFYFTSSRDEKASRNTIPPLKYNINGLEIYFPKDEKAGGTWFATNDNGRTACLLNGAFENHKKSLSYTKSRGLILLESFQFTSILDFKNEINLENIEPFTLLILDYQLGHLNHFFELRWDGKDKHFKELPKDKPQIWSSSTLYKKETRDKREYLFNSWLENNITYKDKNIQKFHNRKHGLSESDDILMKGSGDLQTLSISQIHHSEKNIMMNYLDLLKDSIHSINLTKNNLCQTVSEL